MIKVSSPTELLIAIVNKEDQIIITRSILMNTTIVLPKKTMLLGEPQENGELPLLAFQNSDGIGISSNNSVTNLNIQTPVNKRAIYSTNEEKDLGELRFDTLFITGQFSFVMYKPAEKANVVISNVDIIYSDSRNYLEQPQKYGVSALQGALTIYNFNSNSDSLIHAELNDISIGRKNAPVRGSGIFLAGFGDNGGKLKVNKLVSNNVYSSGNIPFGIANFITAGIFIVNGTHVDTIIQNGETVTYGVNDMVLDAWGEIDDWKVNGQVTSYGPSGVGFVNFGIIKTFTMTAPLETYGLGARGYNQYDGTVENIKFKSIETFGDGSVAIQISKKIGNLTVEEGVKTNGSIGNSLVKGVNMELPAYALSIKEGGSIDHLTINGNLETYGDNVTTYSVENGGSIKQFSIHGTIRAYGNKSKKIFIDKEGHSPIMDLK